MNNNDEEIFELNSQILLYHKKLFQLLKGNPETRVDFILFATLSGALYVLWNLYGGKVFEFLESFINSYASWEGPIMLGIITSSVFILLGGVQLVTYINKIKNYCIRLPIEKLLTLVVEYHIIINKSLGESLTIEEIIIATQRLKCSLHSLVLYRLLFSLFYIDKNLPQALDLVNILESRWTYLIILDLRTDLQMRMNEQKETLANAKETLKTNLGDKPELQGITALQSERLDRQIEAFEKLQKRVLV